LQKRKDQLLLKEQSGARSNEAFKELDIVR